MGSPAFVTALAEEAHPDEPRTLDLRVELHAPDGSLVLATGGIWDRAEKAWLPGEPATARVVRLHAGQLESARWVARWIEGNRDGDAYTAILWGSRAAGKTFLAIALVVAFAVATPGSITWVVNQTVDSGDECRREIEGLLPKSWASTSISRSGELRFHLRNGSLIRLRSAAKPSTLRAGRCDLLILNEAATMSRAAYDNARPRVADRSGLVIACSNPADHERGRWVERLRDQAAHGEVAVIEFTLRGQDNPHVDQAALESRKHELSEIDWAKERYGKPGPIGDVALHAWRREINFVDPPKHFENCTAEIARVIYGLSLPYVIGMDFQSVPYCCAVVQQYLRDPDEPDQIKIWISDYATAPDEHELIRELEDLGYDGSECIVVPDASGAYQDAKHDTRGLPSARILAAAGWRNIYNPVPGSKKNPDVLARLRATNALLRDASGCSRLFVSRDPDADLEVVAEALERLPLKRGRPDGRSQSAHLYDAVAYPCWRFHRAIVVGERHLQQNKRRPKAA